MRERERENETPLHTCTLVYVEPFATNTLYKHLALPALLTMMDAVPVAASGVCPTKSVTDRKV